MRKLLMATAMLGITILPVLPAFAQGSTCTFETRQGFFRSPVWGKSSTGFIKHDATEGKPAPSLAIHGNWGFGWETNRPDLTGDYQAKGIRRIQMDMKILTYFYNPANGPAHPEVFIRRDHNSEIWKAPVQGFTHTTGQWQRIYVDLDPAWTDAQAMQNGWERTSAGFNSAPSFSDTCKGVTLLGMWFYIPDVGSESHTRIDNLTITTHLGLKMAPTVIKLQETPKHNPKFKDLKPVPKVPPKK